MSQKLQSSFLLCLGALAISTSVWAGNPCEDFAWKAGGGLPGFDATARAVAVYDDGTGPALYAGGDFVIAGDELVNQFARWDGARWIDAGGGITNASGIPGSVHAMVVYNSELIVAGDFTHAGGVLVNGIARWNGQRWADLDGGLGPHFDYLCMTIYDGELILGGSFESVGGVTANQIARWNGTSWASLGSGINNEVNALTVFNGQLIAGGNFQTAGGVQARSIARWNGSSWSALGTGMQGEVGASVNALAVYNGQLYAGGNFNSAGSIAVKHIARWNGTQWSNVGSGIGGTPKAEIYAMNVWNNKLMVGGAFFTAGPVQASFIASWNGTNWASLGQAGQGLGAPPFAFTNFNDQLIVAGFFIGAGGQARQRIAGWDGSQWHRFGTPGLDNAVHTMAEFQGQLVQGGQFTSFQNTQLGNIVLWNGDKPSDLAGGVSGLAPEINGIFALHAHNDLLYAGGNFFFAGSTLSPGVAAWNGTTWLPVAGGTGSTVAAFTSYEGDLVIGGAFVEADGEFVRRVVRWDGSKMTPLGEGIGSDFPSEEVVLALTVYNGDLIASGLFQIAGTEIVNGIARWDGKNWNPMGNGLTENFGFVDDIQVYKGELYATGSFGTADQISSPFIARWDGTQWQSVEAGLNNSGSALTEFNGELIVGGQFSSVGNRVSGTGGVARWNGQQFDSLENGILGEVIELFEFNGQLHAGGFFLTAGDEVSAFSAVWGLSCTGDITGDGFVNVDDLLAVINSWGTCSAPCSADVAPEGGDGQVDVDDLLQVINSWS